MKKLSLCENAMCDKGLLHEREILMNYTWNATNRSTNADKFRNSDENARYNENAAKMRVL
jgi:hypothetical protein